MLARHATWRSPGPRGEGADRPELDSPDDRHCRPPARRLPRPSALARPAGRPRFRSRSRCSPLARQTRMHHRRSRARGRSLALCPDGSGRAPEGRASPLLPEELVATPRTHHAFLVEPPAFGGRLCSSSSATGTPVAAPTCAPTSSASRPAPSATLQRPVARGRAHAGLRHRHGHPRRARRPAPVRRRGRRGLWPELALRERSRLSLAHLRVPERFGDGPRPRAPRAWREDSRAACAFDCSAVRGAGGFGRGLRPERRRRLFRRLDFEVLTRPRPIAARFLGGPDAPVQRRAARGRSATLVADEGDPRSVTCATTSAPYCARWKRGPACASPCGRARPVADLVPIPSEEAGPLRGRGCSIPEVEPAPAEALDEVDRLFLGGPDAAPRCRRTAGPWLS